MTWLWPSTPTTLTIRSAVGSVHHCVKLAVLVAEVVRKANIGRGNFLPILIPVVFDTEGGYLYSGLLQALHGKLLRHPFTQRLLPIVTDPAVDMDFGTGDDGLAHCSPHPLGGATQQPVVCSCPAGAVKVTPAHDHTDFQMSQRHSLPRLTVIGGDGTMAAQCGDWLQVGDATAAFRCSRLILASLPVSVTH